MPKTVAARGLLALGFILLLATCRDGMEPQVHLAPVAVAPILPSDATLAAFGLSIDRVRFVVVRAVVPPDTLADTTLALPPDATTLELDLRVSLVAISETLLVSVVALSGATPLFEGTAPVAVRSGTVTAPTDIPVQTYIGPGAGVDSIAILPRSPFIYFGDSLRFQVQAFQGGTAQSQVYVSWSTSDTTIARINLFGVVHGPGSRSAVWVRARAPSGAADSITARFTPAATQLVLIAGGAQTDTVGNALALPLEVEARAADGLGVGGVAVRFRASSGGGSVLDSVVVTDTLGRARTFATLGAQLGAQSIEATAVGLTGSPVAFAVTALAGPPAQLIATAGDAQLAIVGTGVATAPAVVVRDAAGNPIAGVAVTFTVTGGGGGVTGGGQTTGSDGVATVGSWTLGSGAGTNSLRASAAGLTRTFTATGIAGAAAQLVADTGDLQSQVVGVPLAIKPAVRLADQYENPIAGASVAFSVNAGSGSITGSTQLTNGAGVASVGSWTLDTLAGTNVLHATAGAVSTTFTATGLPDAPSLLVKTLGDSQVGVVNATLPDAPTVRLTDRYGNPIAGDTITFFVLVDGGFVGTPISITDASGVASAGAWTLANFVAENILRAEMQAVPTVLPVEFTAVGAHDVAAQLVRVSIDTQTALVNGPVSEPPAVEVVDQYFNSVPGVSVTFTLTGTLIGSLLPGSTVTDSAGIARVGAWTLALTPGLNTLDADVPGLLNSPVTFSANGITTTASTIALDAGDGQSGTVGSALATPYSVAVKDVVGLPVPGVPVTWAVGAGGGFITPASSVTDVNGIASATRTLGGSPGTQTATASVTGLTGSPVTFTATALPDVPAQILKLSVDPQSATVGTAVATPPSVRVVDQFGNAVAGVGVTFAVVAGGGSVTGSTATTDAQGVATVGSWTLGTVAGVGNNQLTLGVAGLQPVTFSATALAAAPTHLTFLVEPSPVLAGDTIDPPVRAAFQDQYGNVNTQITDLVSLQLGNSPTPGAKLSGTVDAAAVNGVAVFGELAIDSAGSGFTIVASSAKLPSIESQPFDVGGVIRAVIGDRLQPVDAAFDRTSGLVFVPGLNNTLGVFDPGKGQLSQFSILQSAPFAVAVNSVTGRTYVTTQAGAVVVIDTRDPTTPLGVINVQFPARGIAVDEATDRVFVAVEGDPFKGGPPSLLIINGELREVVGAIPFQDGALPGNGVAFNANDGLVYVAIPNLGVGVFDPSKLQHVLTVPIPGEKGAAETYDVAVDLRRNLVYATNRSDSSFSVIDPAGVKELERVRVGDLPEGLGVDPDRGVVYVANSGTNTLSFIAPDPKAGRFAVFATLVVGPGPKAAAVNPLTGQVYVPTFTDDQVRVVQP